VEVGPTTFPSLTQTGESPGTKCRNSLSELVRGSRSNLQWDSGAILSRYVDEECYLRVCASNLPQPDTDTRTGESQVQTGKHVNGDGGSHSNVQGDSGGDPCPHVDEKSHLIVCTSNFPPPVTDRGNNRYKSAAKLGGSRFHVQRDA